MTTIDTSTVVDTGCPSWCTNHLDGPGPEDICHERGYAVGDDPRLVTIAQFPLDEDGQPSGNAPFIDMDQLHTYSSTTARQIAGALLAAADKLDELTGVAR